MPQGEDPKIPGTLLRCPGKARGKMLDSGWLQVVLRKHFKFCQIITQLKKKKADIFPLSPTPSSTYTLTHTHTHSRQGLYRCFSVTLRSK